MSDAEAVDSLTEAERRLQAAQLSSDVTALDELIDDRLLFTGPDGSLLTKADDLDAHRSGAQTLHRLDEIDLRIRVFGSTGVTWLLADVAGTFGGQSVTARLRYTRTWVLDERNGWQVVAAHATAL
jgi:ketosteroid isomerase-like protein